MRNSDHGHAPARYARRWLWLALAIVGLDQATKQLANTMLPPYQSLPLAPMLNLTLVYNPGAAFSFLSEAGGWQRWFFIALSSVVSVVLLRWIWRAQTHKSAAALSLVLGGALGNLIDRLAHGYVIDFIDVYYRQYHWPVFNIADSAITIGAALLLWELLFNPAAKAG